MNITGLSNSYQSSVINNQSSQNGVISASYSKQQCCTNTIQADPAIALSLYSQPKTSSNMLQGLVMTMQAVASFQWLNRFASNVSNGYQSAASQARQDKAQGLSIREGLNNFNQVHNALRFLNVYAHELQANQHQGFSQAQGSTFEQLGNLSQQYYQKHLQTQLLGYLGKQVGVDLSSTSVVDLAKNLINSSSAKTAAAKGISGTTSNGLPGLSSKALGAAGAAYSTYQLIDNWGKSTPAAGAVQGATTGAYVGSYICPGIGTAVGAVIGGIAGGLIGCIKSGKHKDQLARDAMREQLIQVGLSDKEYNLELANGEKYYIGHDGRHKYTNTDGTQRSPYQIDGSNPLSHQTVGWAQTLATMLTGGDKKLTSDFTGYFANAALSNATDLATAQKNILAIYNKMNISPAMGFQVLRQLHATGKYDQNTLAAYENGFATLLNGQVADGAAVGEAKGGQNSK